MMNTVDILSEIAFYYFSEHDRGISKTRLLKLAYLVEVEYMRRNRSRLTNLDWVYYLYGPYLFDYDHLLHESGMIIEKKDIPDEKQTEIIYPPTNYTSSIDLTTQILIHKIVHQFGSMELRQLLDYVYFETEPMMNVNERLEHLDFLTVLPEEYYSVKELKIPPKKEKELKKAFQKRVEKFRAKRIT